MQKDSQTAEATTLEVTAFEPAGHGSGVDATEFAIMREFIEKVQFRR